MRCMSAASFANFFSETVTVEETRARKCLAIEVSLSILMSELITSRSSSRSGRLTLEGSRSYFTFTVSEQKTIGADGPR